MSVRSLAPRLPAAVWTLEAGALASAFGSGVILPFAVIYLHAVRGFGVGDAAAVVAVISAVGIVSGPVAGWTADRWSARATLAGALVLLAAGSAALAFVRVPWQAYAAAVVSGMGNGARYPAQSSLIGGLTGPANRHVAFSLHRTMINLGYGLGGVVGGVVASASEPVTYQALFLADAATYAIYAVTLAWLPAGTGAGARVRAAGGRYRAVLRDRAFVRLLAINAAYVGGGYALFETLVPVYATSHAGVGTAAIGVFFLVNTAFIVVAQLPITRLAEGRRRMPALAAACAAPATALLVVLAGGGLLHGAGAGALLAVAFVVLAVGECLQGTVVSPTTADLAPPELLGRYMALTSFTWQLGLAAGPAAGGFLLGAAPAAVWIGGAAVCLVAAVAALRLERRLPVAVRRTPSSAG